LAGVRSTKVWEVGREAQMALQPSHKRSMGYLSVFASSRWLLLEGLIALSDSSVLVLKKQYNMEILQERCIKQNNQFILVKD